MRKLLSLRAAVAITSIVTALVLTSCAGGFQPAQIAEDVSEALAEGKITSKNAADDIFPAEVAGLHLTSTVKGEDALSLIVSFFGTGYAIKDSYIACYSGSRHELVFWIVEMSKESDSRALFGQIEGRISRSAQFSDHRQHSSIAVSSMVHYARFSGQGSSPEHNFYYRNGNRVYWASVRGDKQLETLRPFLNEF